jgi:hypothetical protein
MSCEHPGGQSATLGRTFCCHRADGLLHTGRTVRQSQHNDQTSTQTRGRSVLGPRTVREQLVPRGQSAIPKRTVRPPRGQSGSPTRTV